MKRIWTNPAFYRNVSDADTTLAIWHLPAEKTYGLRRLYDFFMDSGMFGLDIPDADFLKIVQETLGVPHLTLRKKGSYYVSSYYRALKKRFKKMPIVRQLSTSA